MNIRLEKPSDYDDILQLTFKAFLTLDYVGRRRMDEHYLVSLLKDSESVVRELCYVAEMDGEIVGHILFATSAIKKSDGTLVTTLTFGPLSVLPVRHHQGIGAALLRHSLSAASRMGYGAVVIVGVPEYYPKVGFRRGREYQVTFEDDTSPDELMVYELQQGYLDGGGVFCELAKEYEQSEKDDAGFGAFHRQFMKKYYPQQVVLRMLYDNDVSLFEEWVQREHVRPWYEHQQEWLHEIRNRYGEFSFIKHFIAEYEGVPIGFCQYYDMYLGQEHEECIRIDTPGKCYSIDYLIGESEYLRKGYGVKMITLLLEKLKLLGADTVLVQPEASNVRSCQALVQSGFTWDGAYYRWML